MFMHYVLWSNNSTILIRISIVKCCCIEGVWKKENGFNDSSIFCGILNKCVTTQPYG